MGRHNLARRRRKSSVFKAVIVAPAAMLVTAAGGSSFLGLGGEPQAVVSDVTPCCLQVVAVPSAGLAAPSAAWRIVDENADRVLPVGIAPEKGLQVRTILAERSVSAAFPEIREIGGVRADALRWHPNGLALDVMIPDPSSAEGKALGDKVVAFALENAARFGLNHVIWRGTIHFPDGTQRSASGHYDHVHIATNGGGYPTGSETYLR